MGKFTNQGYIADSADTIRENFNQKMLANDSSFKQESADIQNALLDTSILPLMHFENNIALLANAPSLDNSNEFMFLLLAGMLGLKPKSAYKSQVVLEFSGNYGDYIPKGCKVGEFETSADGIIPTTKKLRLLATSDTETIYQANTLTSIDTNLNISGLSVTNPSASLAKVDEETFAQFKERVQSTYRNARGSTSDYVKSLLKGIEGVTPRLVNSRITSFKDSANITWQGMEFVIGGGDSAEIANALFNCLEFQKLVSSPSNNETDRTQKVNINYAGNKLQVCYTLPKLINFGLKIQINFQSLNISASNVEIVISDILTEYINNLVVGHPLNKLKIQSLIINALADYNVDSSEISLLNIIPQTSDNGATFTDIEWGDNGYLKELEFDCYLTLKNLVCEITQ